MTRCVSPPASCSCAAAAAGRGQTLAVEAQAERRRVHRGDRRRRGTQVRVLGRAGARAALRRRRRRGAGAPTTARRLRHRLSLRRAASQVIDAYVEYVCAPHGRGLRARARPGDTARRSASGPRAITPTSGSCGRRSSATADTTRCRTAISNTASRSSSVSPRRRSRRASARPADVGEAIRRAGLDTVLRAAGRPRPVILGASYIDTMPVHAGALRARAAPASAASTCAWMRAGVQVRGEWLGGRPFDGTRPPAAMSTSSCIARRWGRSPLLARAERLAYDGAAPHALYTHRYTAGARVRLWRGLAASAGVDATRPASSPSAGRPPSTSA